MAERLLLVDSDIFVLLAASGTLSRVAELLEIPWAQLRRLAALSHMLRGGKTFQRKYSQDIRNRACAVADTVSPLLDRPQDDERLPLLLSIAGIDDGEALLFGLLAESGHLLTSGDKRSMQALAEQESLRNVRQLVAGRIICLESILKTLVLADGLATTAQAWLPLVESHKSLTVIFSEVNRKDQDRCLECLDSMLRDLQNRLGPDFLYSV